ncbi:hypothetical protein GCM10009806_13870 [Microbacterium flavum]
MAVKDHRELPVPVKPLLLHLKVDDLALGLKSPERKVHPSMVDDTCIEFSNHPCHVTQRVKGVSDPSYSRRPSYLSAIVDLNELAPHQMPPHTRRHSMSQIGAIAH